MKRKEGARGLGKPRSDSQGEGSEMAEIAGT